MKQPTVATIVAAARRLRLPVGSRQHRHQVSRGTWDRNREIIARFLAGETQTALAREFGVTRQRLQQIVRGYPTRAA